MVNFKEDEQLKTLNHSCAHLMAQAIKHLDREGNEEDCQDRQEDRAERDFQGRSNGNV